MMSYNKEKMFELAKKQIQDNNLFFVEDIVAFMPCGKTWFYENFKVDSDEMNNLKEMLENNKIKTKSSIRTKLWKSDKAAELLALYRLIATPEEHQKLNQSYVDHTSKGDKIEQKTNVIITDAETAAEYNKILAKFNDEADEDVQEDS